MIIKIIEPKGRHPRPPQKAMPSVVGGGGGPHAGPFGTATLWAGARRRVD